MGSEDIVCYTFHVSFISQPPLRQAFEPLINHTNFLPNIEIVGSHALLQQENPEYDLKRQKLYEYYHPLEIDPTIPLDEKAKLMEEWYETLPTLYMEISTRFCYSDA